MEKISEMMIIKYTVDYFQTHHTEKKKNKIREAFQNTIPSNPLQHADVYDCKLHTF